MSTARNLAIANENRSIDESTARAVEARNKPRNALEAMASRLQVSPAGLKDTLIKTVFSACKSEAEFIALTIVANAYDLNPLTKEIYAFPKKGGGIMPMISYDGWIKIMNSHPQTDGFEFIHTLNEKGDAVAAEGVFYRKDRSRPTKKMVYLKEFKKNTEPWNNSPNHMLDVRCLCHTVRIALGINAGVEGDDEVIDGGTVTAQSLPTRQALSEELNDSIPAFDAETGEVARDPATGMSEVDEETARALDANDGTLSEENPSAAEGPADEQRGEATEDEKPAWWAKVQWMKDMLGKAKNGQQIKEVEGEYLRDAVMLPQEVANEIEEMMRAKRAELSAAKAKGGENGQ